MSQSTASGYAQRQTGAPCETLSQEPVGQGLVVPKQEQLELVAQAGGTSTQCDGNGPASGGNGIPLHSITQTCDEVHVAVPHGDAARAVVVQTEARHRT